MPTLTTQDWINRALRAEPVWDIGQIDKPTKKALDALVREGCLLKTRAYWMSLGALKTVWYRPENEPQEVMALRWHRGERASLPVTADPA